MALGESALYTNPGIYFAGNYRFGNLSVLMALDRVTSPGKGFPRGEFFPLFHLARAQVVRLLDFKICERYTRSFMSAYDESMEG